MKKILIGFIALIIISSAIIAINVVSAKDEQPQKHFLDGKSLEEIEDIISTMSIRQCGILRRNMA